MTTLLAFDQAKLRMFQLIRQNYVCHRVCPRRGKGLSGKTTYVLRIAHVYQAKLRMSYGIAKFYQAKLRMSYTLQNYQAKLCMS